MSRLIPLRGGRLGFVCAAIVAAVGVTARPAGADLPHVHWIAGAKPTGTPARYDRVGVLKVGSAHARNVLVLEPGTSAGSAYFLPLARWIVAAAKGWQVWAVERRENLLEDQSELERAKRGRASATQLFDYYLGFLRDASIRRHFKFIPNRTVAFAKRWGMRVAVLDLHRVIAAARKLGGKVVLGGHSLGGAVVTAYATWDFDRHPGADGLAGLVYIDGGSFGTESVAAARSALANLSQPATSPWYSFGGIPAPFAGIYNATGSTAALIAPGGASLGESSGLFNGLGITPSVPVTNLAQYGYALNVATSPAGLIAAQAHLGTGLSLIGGPPFGWNGSGALTPLTRFAQMFSGTGVAGADGTEWYFPDRLTLDTAAVNDGIASPAQRVLGLRTNQGMHLPRSLLIYAFGARLSGPGNLLLNATTQLARQSHIPARNVILINRPDYAHNDPAGAYPTNVFFTHLLAFLHRVAERGR